MSSSHFPITASWLWHWHRCHSAKQPNLYSYALVAICAIVPPREPRKVNRSILVQHMSRYIPAEAERQVLACSFMQKKSRPSSDWSVCPCMPPVAATSSGLILWDALGVHEYKWKWEIALLLAPNHVAIRCCRAGRLDGCALDERPSDKFGIARWGRDKGMNRYRTTGTQFEHGN